MNKTKLYYKSKQKQRRTKTETRQNKAYESRRMYKSKTAN